MHIDKKPDPYHAGYVALCAIVAIVFGVVGLNHFLTVSTACTQRVSYNAEPAELAPAPEPQARPISFAKIPLRAR